MNKKLFQIATQIRTPLSLVALTIIALYLIFKSVLGLGVFANLGPTDTQVLLNSIVSKAFIIALVALPLGLVAYLSTSLRGHRRQSSPQPAEHTLDLAMSSLRERASFSQARGCSLSVTLTLLVFFTTVTSVWVGMDYLHQVPKQTDVVKLQGAGTTFPNPLYQEWFREYNKANPSATFDYQSIGSGSGVKQISHKEVDFGSSDSPMTDDSLKEIQGKLLHIPTVIGAVVLTHNLSGIQGELKLTPDAISGIFLGRIKRWNDPRIASVNAGIEFPASEITVVHRSDGNGTTSVFTDYLSKISPEWKKKPGTGSVVDWPVGTGAKGNEGVAGQVKQTPNSIGYVELIYATQNKLPFASIRDLAGEFVRPSLESVTAAAAATPIPDDLRVSITNAVRTNAYPIAFFSYLLVYQDQSDRAKGKALVGFLWWAIHDGQRQAQELFYAPLPEVVVEKAEREIKSITYQGEVLHTVR